MKISIDEARSLLEQAMRRSRFNAHEAEIIADHLLDCELRGVTMGGMSRALTIIEMFGGQPENRDPIEVQKETPYSAAVEGSQHIGYLVGRKATETAIHKAKDTGIGVVTARSAIFSGMLSYYSEMITREGFVSFSTSSAGPLVAPEGGTEARLGTNPIAFGFPSAGDPVIWDIGTSKIMLADAVLAQRLGRPLAEDVAFDPSGAPTTDPAKAIDGAIKVWGGHKGSGLALCVQLMGILAGAEPMPDKYGGIGFFVLALNPDLVTSPERFQRDVATFTDLIRATRPKAEDRPVRIPFDRSRALRASLLEAGVIDVPEDVLRQLRSEIG